MNTSHARRAILLLGFPGSGVEIARDALIASGATEDGAEPLARMAARIAGDLGVSITDPGPIALTGRGIVDSAAEISRRLHHDRAARAAKLLAVVPTHAPLLLAASEFFLAPHVWIQMFAEAGIATEVVLVDRNPLALFDSARGAGASVRKLLFSWHYLTLRLLAAAPDTRVIPFVRLVQGGDIDPRLGIDGRWPAEGSQLHPRDTANLAVAPVASKGAAALQALLEGWDGLDRAARASTVAGLEAGLAEAMATTGIARRPKKELPPAAPERAPAKTTAAAATGQPLILHYHLFKNAGTSVDAMLKANFGARWADAEFTGGSADEKRAALATLLADRSDIDAFSSHTALLPVPEVAGRTILPILFIRHPLLRIRSAYAFERQQDAQTSGALLARETDFAGYVSTQLDQPRNRQIRDFQTNRLAFGTPGPAAREHQRALTTLTALPFVGLVERYDASIARFSAMIRAMFPAFEPLVVRRNATSDSAHEPIHLQLERLRNELGDALYAALSAANAHDLEIFERVASQYDFDLSHRSEG